MKRFAGCVFAFVLLFLAQQGVFAQPPQINHNPTYHGVYFQTPEGKFLVLADTANGRMRVVGQHTKLLRRLDSLYLAIADTSYPRQPIAVELRGRPYPGRAGAVGDFHLNEIVSAGRMTAWNSQGFYTFWGMGNEPFWDLMISERLATVALFDPNEARFHIFPYAPPQSTEPNVWDYNLTRPGHTLRVRIERRTCSDGMSNRDYPFHAEVYLDGRAFIGCAVTAQEQGVMVEE